MSVRAEDERTMALLRKVWRAWISMRQCPTIQHKRARLWHITTVR